MCSMRTAGWALAAFLFAGPLQASEAALNRAMDAIRRHGLLTPKQLRYSFLTESHRAGNVVTVDVREKHNKTCGGDPNFAPCIFSLEFDMRTGAVQWDNTPDTEMAPFLSALAEGRSAAMFHIFFRGRAGDGRYERLSWRSSETRCQFVSLGPDPAFPPQRGARR